MKFEDLTPERPERADDLRLRLRQAIEHAAQLLPAQGPITAFVFLNTLQALEDLPFDDGLRQGAKLFGCQPYLSEERYRQKLERGRIRLEDLLAVLQDDLGERANEAIGPLGTRLRLRMAMVQHPLREGPIAELRWFVAMTDALTRIRPEAASNVRERVIEETRRWVMRDLRGNGDRSHGQSDQSQLRLDRLRSAMLELMHEFNLDEIENWSDETWESFSLNSLWRVCRLGVEGVAIPTSCAGARGGVSPLVHSLLNRGADATPFACTEPLIRFCAAFLDQGFAHWTLPNREAGFFKSFAAMYQTRIGAPGSWLSALPEELIRIETAGMSPMDSLIESLTMLGLPEEFWEQHLTAELLALRGWAGMLWQAEERGDRFAIPVPRGTLIEYLAVRLILNRLGDVKVTESTVAKFARTWESSRPAHVLANVATTDSATDIAALAERRAFLIFQIAQILEWSPWDLSQLSAAEWSRVVSEIETFHELERRRIFHAAFERQFRMHALNTLSIYTARPPVRVTSPRFQAVFCIDAREESFRRHLEEFAPDVETFGTAGFFAAAMYYRGAGEAHFSTLCPIVVRPKHWVVEDVVYTFEEQSRRRSIARRAIGKTSRGVHVGSRGLAAGAMLTAGLGVLATAPLVARVLFPRLTSRIRRAASRFVAPPRATRLRLERIAAESGPDDDQIGFSIDEMTNIGERVLKDIGLTTGFARLLLILGHGSACLNNPHKSAYDCGACSGSAGGPNARAVAAMLNDVRVRERLTQRGIVIPRETHVIGGLHNTCNDSITFFDLDLLPHSHQRDYESALDTLQETCDRNAHERCRRFHSAALNLTPTQARQHVEGRAEDLAQTRPEYGNASNALCVVGRRSRTRGLFLDRRSFLVSYDPTIDDAELTILARTLAAVVPVCSGINLQYFFSAADSPGWGSDTKLPHNVTSLLGVMDGAASDLRSGLPWQGVEIHEAMRLLFVIETTPAAIFLIMARNATVGNILRNGWVQLAVLDPDSSRLQLFRNGQFEDFVPPEIRPLEKAASSMNWYRGWREHLEFAEIGDGSGNTSLTQPRRTGGR